MTHTYALLPVSKTTFDEIKKAFDAAGYDDAFDKTDNGLAIDMHGIALIQDDGKMFNIVRYQEARNGKDTS